MSISTRVCNLVLLTVVLVIADACSPRLHAQTQQTKKSPLRIRQTSKVKFELNGKPTFYPFSQVAQPVYAVDLLKDEKLIKALRLSDQGVIRIDKELAVYQKAVAEFAKKHRVGIHGIISPSEIKQIEESRNRILNFLSNSQRQELLAIDRFLYFRMHGSLSYLKVFRPDIELTYDQKNKLSKLQKQLASKSLSKGVDEWKRTIDKIIKLLEKEPQLQAWAKKRSAIFKSPFYSDITIAQLDDAKKPPQASKIPKNVSFADFEKVANYRIDYELGLDGNWQKLTVRNAEQLNANLIGILMTTTVQDQIHDSNDLEITKKQKTRLTQLRIQLGNELQNELDKISDITQTDKIDALVRNFCRQLWENGLFPHQQRFTVQILKNLDDIRTGPICFLANASLSRQTKSEIRREIKAFEAKLLRLEKETHRHLFDLMKELAGKNKLELSMDDRPRDLNPCMSIMYAHSDKLQEFFRKPPKRLFDDD